VTLKPKSLDSGNACGSIGPEDKTKQLGNDVIELLAVDDITVFRTIGTRRIMLFDVTGADCAPGGFRVVSAPRTLVFEVFPAGSAEETAVGNQQMYREIFHGSVVTAPNPSLLSNFTGSSRILAILLSRSTGMCAGSRGRRNFH
jgi:hypothetical protein